MPDTSKWTKKDKREDFVGKMRFVEGKREGKRGWGRANVELKGHELGRET
jgi:hypothetical protein